MNKPDFSKYLAHFTKDGICVNDNNILHEEYMKMNAKERLISILKLKKIYRSTMPWTSAKVVCFTECPWSSFIEHTKQYSSYGIGFSKSYIYSHSGAPAYYMRADLFDQMKKRKGGFDSIVLPFITPFYPIYSRQRKEYLPKKPVDYTHEREWRTTKDLPFEYKNIEFVVVKSNEDINSFPEELIQAIGIDKFLVMDNYKLIETLWPVHKL